ncbi:hypothetical protein AMECASPLE_026277 [Ameca splendens]|uniref:Uncharacterized protein n=1 Tax=Ameca splendens TaxID=208324 RepID=A0ABV0YRV3_9TELE
MLMPRYFTLPVRNDIDVFIKSVLMGRTVDLSQFIEYSGEDAPQSHLLLPVLQEAADPLTAGGRDFELEELLVEDVLVLKAKPKSTNRIQTYVPGWSRCCRMKCSPKLTASSADLFAR